jgi:spermidine/putrescine-binding protein
MANDDFRPAASLGRRAALNLAGAASLAGMRASSARADATDLQVLLPNVLVSGKLRSILEGAVHAKIVDAPYQSGPDAIARLMAPGGTSRFDLMFSLTDFARIPIAGPRDGAEKVLALDLSKIPNAATIGEVFKPDIVSRNGHIYMLPIFMGYNSVLYNYEVVPEHDELTQSWGAIFEDKYAGRIGWFESAHQMIFAAALYLGHAKPETMSNAEVAEVGRFMASKKKNVRTIWTSFAEGANLLATKEIVVTFGPIPVRVQLQQQGVPVTNAWVKEGVESLVGGLFIPKDSTKPEQAYALINTILGTGYANTLPEVSGYLSANVSAGGGLTEAQRMQAGYGIYTGQTKHAPMPLPPNLNTWVETWAKIKSA